MTEYSPAIDCKIQTLQDCEERENKYKGFLSYYNKEVVRYTQYLDEIEKIKKTLNKEIEKLKEEEKVK